MGSAAAYWLSKKTNRKILLLDRYGLANDYCSSNDANRVFRFAYGKDAYYTRMAVESLKLWKTLEKETGEKLLIETDLLLVEGDDEDSNRFNKDSYETMREMGLPIEQLDSSDLKQKFLLEISFIRSLLWRESEKKSPLPPCRAFFSFPWIN